MGTWVAPGSVPRAIPTPGWMGWDLFPSFALSPPFGQLVPRMKMRGAGGNCDIALYSSKGTARLAGWQCLYIHKLTIGAPCQAREARACSPGAQLHEGRVLTHFRWKVARGVGREPACGHLSFSPCPAFLAEATCPLNNSERSTSFGQFKDFHTFLPEFTWPSHIGNRSLFACTTLPFPRQSNPRTSRF